MLEHPSASWLWIFLQPQACALQPNVEAILFDHCQYGDRVLSRQSDSPMLLKHFHFPVQLVTNGPASKSLGLLCRREHSRERSVGSDFFFTSQVAVVLCKSGSGDLAGCQQAAAWFAGGQRRRLIELRRAGDVERNPGMVRRGGNGRWATSGRDLFLLDAKPCGTKLETFRACFSPRGSLDDCICDSKTSRPGWRMSSDIAPRNGDEQTQRTSSLRRHLTWAQTRGPPAPTADTGLPCAKSLLKSWQRSEPVECRTPVPLHVALAITTFFLRKLGTMLQRLL